MSENIWCPNCDSRMGQGEVCPECIHDDADPNCECQHCLDNYWEDD